MTMQLLPCAVRVRMAKICWRMPYATSIGTPLRQLTTSTRRWPTLTTVSSHFLISTYLFIMLSIIQLTSPGLQINFEDLFVRGNTHGPAATEPNITSCEIKSIDFRSSSANNSIAGGFKVCAIQVLMNGGVRLKS